MTCEASLKVDADCGLGFLPWRKPRETARTPDGWDCGPFYPLPWLILIYQGISMTDMTDYQPTDATFAVDRDCKTLSRHVLEQLQSFSPDAQDLSALMNRIALAGKLIARHLSRAGLMESVLGFTGETNVLDSFPSSETLVAIDPFGRSRGTSIASSLSIIPAKTTWYSL